MSDLLRRRVPPLAASGTEAEVAPTRDDGNPRCVGVCRLSPRKDRGKGSLYEVVGRSGVRHGSTEVRGAMQHHPALNAPYAVVLQSHSRRLRQHRNSCLGGNLLRRLKESQCSCFHHIESRFSQLRAQRKSSALEYLAHRAKQRKRHQPLPEAVAHVLHASECGCPDHQHQTEVRPRRASVNCPNQALWPRCRGVHNDHRLFSTRDRKRESQCLHDSVHWSVAVAVGACHKVLKGLALRGGEVLAHAIKFDSMRPFPGTSWSSA